VADKKEKCDSSDEKARELTQEMFGTPEEVREMAKPVRMAQNRYEATGILKTIAQNGALKSKSGVEATLTNKSIDKIVSGQAQHESFEAQAHWQAVANIDKLFSNAIEPWEFELDPNKNNEHLKNRKYLYAPMEYDNRIMPVKFTVKEYKQYGLSKRLYAIEAIDIEIKKQRAPDTDVSLRKSRERPANSLSV
jgi:hypothetical protein